jgi:hypothetical protein
MKIKPPHVQPDIVLPNLYFGDGSIKLDTGVNNADIHRLGKDGAIMAVDDNSYN